jgi:hypothetical protein
MNKPHLLVIALLLAAAIFAGYVWMQPEPPPQQPYPKEPEGVPPTSPPEFSCSIEIAKEGGQEVAYLTVRETHGWYVRHLFVDFWHTSLDPETGERVIDTLNQKKGAHLLNLPLQFGETRTERVVIWPENDHPGTELGTTEDWLCDIDTNRTDGILMPPD